LSVNSLISILRDRNIRRRLDVRRHMSTQPQWHFSLQKKNGGIMLVNWIINHTKN